MGTVNGISKSGVNDAALEASKSKKVIDIGTNQAFQVTEVVATNTNTSGVAVLRIFDLAATGSAPDVTKQKIPDIPIGPEETVRIPFTDGPKFYTEVSAENEGGLGTIAIYNCQVNGVIF